MKRQRHVQRVVQAVHEEMPPGVTKMTNKKEEASNRSVLMLQPASRRIELIGQSSPATIMYDTDDLQPEPWKFGNVVAPPPPPPRRKPPPTQAPDSEAPRRHVRIPTPSEAKQAHIGNGMPTAPTGSMLSSSSAAAATQVLKQESHSKMSDARALRPLIPTPKVAQQQQRAEPLRKQHARIPVPGEPLPNAASKPISKEEKPRKPRENGETPSVASQPALSRPGRSPIVWPGTAVMQPARPSFVLKPQTHVAASLPEEDNVSGPEEPCSTEPGKGTGTDMGGRAGEAAEVPTGSRGRTDVDPPEKPPLEKSGSIIFKWVTDDGEHVDEQEYQPKDGDVYMNRYDEDTWDDDDGEDEEEGNDYNCEKDDAVAAEEEAREKNIHIAALELPGVDPPVAADLGDQLGDAAPLVDRVTEGDDCAPASTQGEPESFDPGMRPEADKAICADAEDQCSESSLAVSGLQSDDDEHMGEVPESEQQPEAPHDHFAIPMGEEDAQDLTANAGLQINPGQHDKAKEGPLAAPPEASRSVAERSMSGLESRVADPSEPEDQAAARSRASGLEGSYSRRGEQAEAESRPLKSPLSPFSNERVDESDAGRLKASHSSGPRQGGSAAYRRDGSPEIQRPGYFQQQPQVPGQRARPGSRGDSPPLRGSWPEGRHADRPRQLWRSTDQAPQGFGGQHRDSWAMRGRGAERSRGSGPGRGHPNPRDASPPQSSNGSRQRNQDAPPRNFYRSPPPPLREGGYRSRSSASRSRSRSFGRSRSCSRSRSRSPSRSRSFDRSFSRSRSCSRSRSRTPKRSRSRGRSRSRSRSWAPRSRSRSRSRSSSPWRQGRMAYRRDLSDGQRFGHGGWGRGRGQAHGLGRGGRDQSSPRRGNPSGNEGRGFHRERGDYGRGRSPQPSGYQRGRGRGQRGAGPSRGHGRGFRSRSWSPEPGEVRRSQDVGGQGFGGRSRPQQHYQQPRPRSPPRGPSSSDAPREYGGREFGGTGSHQSGGGSQEQQLHRRHSSCSGGRSPPEPAEAPESRNAPRATLQHHQDRFGISRNGGRGSSQRGGHQGHGIGHAGSHYKRYSDDKTQGRPSGRFTSPPDRAGPSYGRKSRSLSRSPPPRQLPSAGRGQWRGRGRGSFARGGGRRGGGRQGYHQDRTTFSAQQVQDSASINQSAGTRVELQRANEAIQKQDNNAG